MAIIREQNYFSSWKSYSYLKPSSSLRPKEIVPAPQKVLNQSVVSRRRGTIAAAVASVLLAKETIFSHQTANALEDLVDDRTVEDAESGIRGYAESLFQVKALVEAESWREAQKLLRKSSSNLKQDLYAIIQRKPGTERPLLRKLYSDLFNNVTKLDYAARDQDVSHVWQYYDGIVVILNDILSKI